MRILLKIIGVILTGIGVLFYITGVDMVTLEDSIEISLNGAGEPVYDYLGFFLDNALSLLILCGTLFIIYFFVCYEDEVVRRIISCAIVFVPLFCMLIYYNYIAISSLPERTEKYIEQIESSKEDGEEANISDCITITYFEFYTENT